MRRLLAIGLVLLGVIGTGLLTRNGLGLLGYSGQMISHIGVFGDLGAIEVKGDIAIGQTFLAHHDGLYRIDVMLLDNRRRNSQPVTFHLRQGPESTTDLFSHTFAAAGVRGPTWYTFTFPPLPASAGKVYFFFFESPTSTRGDAVTVGGSELDVYPEGSAFLRWRADTADPAFLSLIRMMGLSEAGENWQAVPADAAFRAYYAGVTTRQKTQSLFAQLAQSKPAIWGSRQLYGWLAGVYLVVVACFIYFGFLSRRT